MSDLKSKLPDLKELSSMTGKLIKGIKNTVEEIIDDYKQKRAEEENEKPEEEVKVETKETKVTKETKTKSKAKKSEE